MKLEAIPGSDGPDRKERNTDMFSQRYDQAWPSQWRHIHVTEKWFRDCQSEYCFFVNYLEAIYFLSHHGLTAHTFSSHLHCHSPWCNHPHDDLIGHQHPLNLPQYLVLHSATETHSRTKRAPCNSWVSRRLWLIALSVCSQGLECFGVCSSHGRRS